MNNYPMSLTKIAGKFGISRDKVLYFLDKEMGYVNGIREVTKKGKVSKYAENDRIIGLVRAGVMI